MAQQLARRVISAGFIHLVAAASNDSKFDWLAIVGIVAGLTSVVLAIVAIWLSITIFRMSQSSSNSIQAATARIENATGQLKTLFETMYTDIFAMTRDTFDDMRRSLWPDRDADAKDDVRDASAERLSQLQAEVTQALSSAARTIGLPDERVSELQTQLEPVVESAIVQSAQASNEASESALRDDIVSLLEMMRTNNEPAVTRRILQLLGENYPRRSIIRELDDLHRRGRLLWSTHELRPNTEISLRTRAEPVPPTGDDRPPG